MPSEHPYKETQNVLAEIRKLVSGPDAVRYSDIAILARTHQVLSEYEIELKLAKVPEWSIGRDGILQVSVMLYCACQWCPHHVLRICG